MRGRRSKQIEGADVGDSIEDMEGSRPAAFRKYGKVKDMWGEKVGRQVSMSFSVVPFLEANMMVDSNNRRFRSSKDYYRCKTASLLTGHCA